MAYFPNGTSGLSFQEQWCSKCVHDEEQNCPVWGAHLLFSYDLCNEKKHPGKVILDMLIPDGGECAMFFLAMVAGLPLLVVFLFAWMDRKDGMP